MKTKINTLLFLRIIFLFAVSTTVFLDSSCRKDNSEGDNLASLINTYFGAVTITQDSIMIDDLMDLSFDEGSSTKGTFFRKNDGAVGIFTGNMSGNTLSINGYIKDNPSSVFSGTIQINDGELLINVSGTDIIGNYTFEGTLEQQKCIDIEGTYFAKETVTYTISSLGDSETFTQSGDGTVFFDQIKCNITYAVPGIDVNRNGSLNGNKLILTGKFVIPLSSDVVITQDTFKAEVKIIDKYHFEFSGKGEAKGTYQGIPFVITGSDTGVFDRRFKVAVAFLHGGPPALKVGDFLMNYGAWNAGDELGLLCAQAGAVDPQNVITFGVGSSINPSQISRVDTWYRTLNKNSSLPNLILVGHSLGGNAVTNSMIQNVYSRITIDPWSPTGLLPDQRYLTLMRTSTLGGFKNILASTTDIIPSYEDPHGLLGYRIANLGNNEWVEDNPPTNHFSIVHRVWEKEYVKNEVRNALNVSKGQEQIQSTLYKIYSDQPIIDGKQPFLINFGWDNTTK